MPSELPQPSRGGGGLPAANEDGVQLVERMLKDNGCSCPHLEHHFILSLATILEGSVHL